jgi:Fe-Mn family superoxide dismutase
MTPAREKITSTEDCMERRITMSKQTVYELPKLGYGYKDLEPYISETVLRLHHDKHHQGYVNGANAVLESLGKAREEKKSVDMTAALKALSFHVGGHVLHSLFWENLTPKAGARATPGGELEKALKKEFGSFERFREEFSAAAGVEGSGWSALAYCRMTGRPLVMQIEKHNVNIYPAFAILMVLDLWEHAYYLDYHNRKAEFIEAFWNIVNWDAVGKRFGSAMR